MYIPACPLTETNAEYLVRQRETFLEGNGFLIQQSNSLSWAYPPNVIRLNGTTLRTLLTRRILRNTWA